MSPAPRLASAPDMAGRIVDSLPFGLLVLDRRGRIVAVNQRLTDLFSLGDADVIGRELGEILRTDDPNWFSLDPIDRLGDPETGRVIEGRLSGRKVAFAVDLAPYLDEDGAGQGTLVFLREPRPSPGNGEDGGDRLISLGDLSACVAHEIRNPLTGIRTTIQFVGRKLDSDDPKQEDIEAVISELDRIEKIIEDLLQFSRPQAGNKVMTALNPLLERTLEALASQCEAAGVAVQPHLRPRLPDTMLDIDMMQRVFFNLITNAIEAMPDGGALKVTSTVRHFRAGPPNLEVFISDTGRGIEPENLEQIFKPFFTTRAAGTGLGLPISLQIVRAHGGRISARNRPRGGAIFRVSLPRTLAPEEP